MPTFEVWYETVVTTPKIKFVAKDAIEALVAYKAKWDKVDVPGDCVKDFKPRAIEVFTVHK
jgi:hypothetical protein